MNTDSRLRFGISLPQCFPEERIDHAYVRQCVRSAETLGFEDCWLTEGVLSRNFNLEPVTYLSYLSAITDRIRLGIAVVILNLRNPVQLAKALATVDQLSNGRVVLGIGLGIGTKLYPAFGVGLERRVARFEEALKVMKALWTEERASLAGEFWRLEDARLQPKPLQRPHLPVIFGGHSEAAMRRAVRLGDGWMASGSSSTEESIESLKRMRGYLREAGRDESRFKLSKRIYIAISDNEASAREKLSAALSYQYGGRDQSGVGLAACASRAVEVICSLRDAGAQHVVLNPVYDHLDQMEVLAAKVVPQL